MATVLSTKKLKLNQKNLLLNGGIGLVEYNAISIEFRDFSLDQELIENAIFTSKNAIKAIAEQDLKIKNCFCVGEKTATSAEKIGFKIIETADNAKELALKIVQNHSEKDFHFFSGNMRRNDLPEILTKNNISYNETMVYETALNIKKFESEFDGILFFSPSAVESFTTKNKLNSIAFCIGNTTANEAKKYTDSIIVASKPAIENVIAKAVSELKNK